jgi:hypothetical protein
MATRYFHGTTAKRFKPGQMLKSGNKLGFRSNYLMVPGLSPDRPLKSGRTVHMHDVVWVCTDVDEAAGWAEHSLLKALPSEIRRMPAGGIAVYEVDPVNLDFPTDGPHSATEAVCDRARVIREVRFEPFEQNLCDECGDLATIGLGTDEQLCDVCGTTTEPEGETS